MKKENGEDRGFKQFTANHTAATKRLVFGKVKFFRGSRVARTVVLVTPITEVICSVLTKRDSLQHHAVLYDIKDILMIRELCDAGNPGSHVK